MTEERGIYKKVSPMCKLRVFFVLMILSLSLLSQYAFSQVGVDINFELGFDGMVKIGRWNPVRVTVRTYSVPFKGSIEIEITEGSIILANITSTRLKSDVDLPVYSEREFLFPVPLSDVRHPVKVSVLSPDGRVIKSTSYDIKDLDMRLPILCLVGSRSLPYRGSGARVLALGTDVLSGKPFWILDPFDALVLDYSSFKSLKDILDKWSLWGGKIIGEGDTIEAVSYRGDTYPGDVDLSSLVSDIIDEELIPIPSKLYASLSLLFYILFFVFLFYYSKRSFLQKILIYLLVSLAFSCFLFITTLNVKEKSDISIQINIMESDKNYPYAKVYSGLAIFSPYDKVIRFGYNPGDFVFWTGRKSKDIAETTFILKEEDIFAELNLGPDKVGLLRGWGVVNFDFKGYVAGEDLNILNRSPYILEDAHLLYRGGYIHLGDIGIGDKTIKIGNERLSTIKEEGVEGTILSWLKNNGIILSGDKNYILGWIHIPLPDFSLESSNSKFFTLCIVEI